MIVMNDRSQAGSAYHQGRIELMLNRRGFTQDDLGNPQPMNERDNKGPGINVTARFYLAFSESREEAFSIMEHRRA